MLRQTRPQIQRKYFNQGRYRRAIFVT